MNHLYQWDDDIIRWYRLAADRHHFHRDLAAAVVPMLPPDARVCDMGCGLGYLSLNLAPHVKRLDAMDRNARVVGCLRELAAQQGVSNLSAYVTDFERTPAPEEKYDAMIFSFYGRTPWHVQAARRWTKEKLIVISNAERSTGFDGRARIDPTCHAGAFAQYLSERHIPYRRQYLELPFGQPFWDLADARRFLACYTDETGTDLEAILQRELVRGRDSPYYLPHMKRMSLFDIDLSPARESGVWETIQAIEVNCR